ncbi:MAG: hypothetical protein PHR84_00565 [Candidatus Omnitrophica bacterium]|nr:hypothetical protein [Candidatus Omnitrophota bacterium]MDD5660779.1 hypothetical protein [Candidatus Omnitrophota bacterium]
MRIILILLLYALLFNTSLSMANEEANKLGNEGILLIQKGKIDAGLDLMKQATQISPDDASWHMNYGSMLFTKGQQIFQSGNKQDADGVLKEAEEELLLAVDLFKTNDFMLISQCYFLIGDIYFYAYSNKNQAKIFYQKSLGYYPEHGGAIEAMKRYQ